MGIPALVDGLFANLLIFDYLYMFRYFRKGKGREGKRGGTRKGKREGKKGIEGKKGREGKKRKREGK